MAKKKKGIFYQNPKYEKYSKIVTFKSRNKAREASKILYDEAKSAKTEAKIIRIEKVAILASNRAKAASKNPKLKPETRRRMRDISKIYHNLANRIKSLKRRTNK